MKDHDKFESLAGAVALGEATPAERATFEAHAGACALCAQDLADLHVASPLEVLLAARDDETWRPSVDRAIVSRIRERRAKTSRLTVGALGWAAALSIAVNVAFVTGISGQVADALHPATDAPQVASFGIRLPARTFARVAKPPRAASLPYAIALRPHKHLAPRTFAAALAKSPTQPQADTMPDPVDVSDLLDTHASNAHRSVAVEVSIPVARP